MDRHRGTRAFVLAVLAIAGSGCAARTAHVSEPALTCAQAVDAARGALVRLRYTVVRIDPAAPGAPGTVVGVRQSEMSAGTLLRSGYEAARGRSAEPGRSGPIVVDSDADPSTTAPDPVEHYTATVTVTCSDSGAELSAVSDESGLTQLDFPNRFVTALRYWLDHKPATARPQEEEAQGLVVRIEPQRGRSATSEFGADLPALGVTPVRIRLDNRTPRRYAFRTTDVVLVTVQGTRNPPFSVDDVVSRLGTQADAAAVADRVRAQALRDGELAPGESLSGYLFLPAAAYQRVRLTVLDVETQEEEGVSAEF